MTKILITGGAGFIGSAILNNSKFSKFKIKVIDRFFFGEEIINKYKKVEFIKNDIRELKISDFRGVDIVYDLAALSNDPSCELDKKLTNDINFKGRVNCAINAKKAGVKKYIFMSSCSVYGKNNLKNLNEQSDTDPVSEYAKACLKVENEIRKISDKKFNLTILRNATVFGYSADRMRFDLVVNLMTASSFYEKKIYILGGGQQIRPLICADDKTDYLYEISNSNNKNYNNQIFNIGKENLKVIDVAKIVKRTINNNTKLIIVPDDDDKRNYHINFSKAEKTFKFKPKISIEFAVKQIYQKLSSGSSSKDLKSSTINWYKHLIESKKLSPGQIDDVLKVAAEEGNVFYQAMIKNPKIYFRAQLKQGTKQKELFKVMRSGIGAKQLDVIYNEISEVFDNELGVDLGGYGDEQQSIIAATFFKIFVDKESQKRRRSDIRSFINSAAEFAGILNWISSDISLGLTERKQILNTAWNEMPGDTDGEKLQYVKTQTTDPKVIKPIVDFVKDKQQDDK